MRTDVLMEWSLKYSSPWQQQQQQRAEASVNMRTIY